MRNSAAGRRVKIINVYVLKLDSGGVSVLLHDVYVSRKNCQCHEV